MNVVAQPKLFISYAHADAQSTINDFWSSLREFLKTPERNWEKWDDKEILVGQDWDKTIGQALENKCNCCLLLVSDLFIKSSYILDKEWPKTLSRNMEEGILFFPVVFGVLERGLSGLPDKMLQFQVYWPTVADLYVPPPHNVPYPDKVRQCYKDVKDNETARDRFLSRLAKQMNDRFDEYLIDQATKSQVLQKKDYQFEKEHQAAEKTKAKEIDTDKTYPSSDKLLESKLNIKSLFKKKITYRTIFLVLLSAVIFISILHFFPKIHKPKEDKIPKSKPNEDLHPAQEKIHKNIFINDIGMEFVLVSIGSRDKDLVSKGIIKPFWLQTTEVTQKQYYAVMKNNPSTFINCGEDCPVESVSWEDAQEFIKNLNKMYDTNEYRLPTVSEWEYACNLNTFNIFSFGNDENEIANYAWVRANSEDSPHPVKMKSPSTPMGIYDIHGNVWEFCFNTNNNSIYREESQKKPKKAIDNFVLKGGSWNDFHFYAQCKYNELELIRDSISTKNNVGFRCVSDRKYN